MAFTDRFHNRGSISTATYDIDNSCKFETANTESLTKSQTASNRRTWTLSFWFKKTKVDSALQYIFQSVVNSSTTFDLFVNGTTDWRVYEYVSGSRNIAFYSTVPLTDPSAWYHLVIACDTTQSSAADRFKIYLNGEDLTAVSGYFSTAAYPAQNYETHINNSAATLSIGKSTSASTNLCGYISELNFIDGLMKDEEDFGKYDHNGIWHPIEYTGAYGDEGYFLDFADAGDLGDDESGNGKDFTENNIAAANQANDTPTNNFCTMNPLWTYANAQVISEGGTKTLHNASTWAGAKASFGVTRGKWYWEYKTISGNGTDVIIGIQTDEGVALTGNAHNIISTAAWYIGGEFWVKDATNGRNSVDVTINSTASHNHTYGFTLDMDSSPQRISVYQNNSVINAGDNINIDGLGGKTVFPFAACYATNGITFNLGGCTISSISSAATDANGYGTFEYAPPSGFYAICTKNLAQYGG